MATFLEGCQELLRDSKLSGSLSSVTGQTGMLARVVNWYADAEYEIKKIHPDWDFMLGEGEITLSTGEDTYNGPTQLGTYNTDSFWIDSGTDDAAPLTYKKYRDYLARYKHFNWDNDYPDIITVRPDKRIVVVPAPSSTENGKIISFDYWKKPTRLANNSDESPIPDHFHEVIIWRARMYHAAWKHDNGAYEEALAEFKTMLRNLESYAWPGQENDDLGTALGSMVIEVADGEVF